MENTTTKPKNKIQKVFSVIGTVLVTLYVVLALIFSISVFTSMGTGHPNVFGYTLLYVETNSMEGDKEDSLFIDDLVVCKEVDTDTIEVGDIIAFDALIYNKDDFGNIIGEPYIIVKIHRVVEISGQSFITRGDNVEKDEDGNFQNDSPVKAADVLGRYEGFRISKLGGAIKFLSSQNGILFCLVIPMAAFLIYALYKFVKAMIEYKMEKEAANAPGGELSEAQKQAAIAEYLAKQAESEAAKEADAENDDTPSDN